MPPDELPVTGHHAAEVLGPGPINHAVDDHVNVLDVPCLQHGPELLGLRREAEESVNLAVGDLLHGIPWGLSHPADVFSGIQAHERGHAGDEEMTAGSQLADPDRLPFQVENLMDPIAPEQLEAPRVAPRENDNGVAGLNPHDEPRVEMHVYIGLAGR